jgi:predicted ATP-dependent serine protease
LKEAEKLGFSAAIVPPRRARGKDRAAEQGLAIREVAHLRELVGMFENAARRPARAGTAVRP